VGDGGDSQGGWHDDLAANNRCELCGAEREGDWHAEPRVLPAGARAMLGQVLMRFAMLPPRQRDAICLRLVSPGVSLRDAGIAPRSTASDWLGEVETLAPGLSRMLGKQTRATLAQRRRRKVEEDYDARCIRETLAAAKLRKRKGN
jgi:hypothetical protein